MRNQSRDYFKNWGQFKIYEVRYSEYEEKNFSGTFEASAMFIDISGFTAMTAELMKNGKEGAEILIEIINKVFTPAIDAIYKNGGFISTFGGDSFNAIFKNGSAVSSLLAGNEIGDIFHRIF